MSIYSTKEQKKQLIKTPIGYDQILNYNRRPCYHLNQFEGILTANQSETETMVSHDDTQTIQDSGFRFSIDVSWVAAELPGGFGVSLVLRESGDAHEIFPENWTMAYAGGTYYRDTAATPGTERFFMLDVNEADNIYGRAYINGICLFNQSAAAYQVDVIVDGFYRSTDTGDVSALYGGSFTVNNADYIDVVQVVFNGNQAGGSYSIDVWCL